LAAPPNRNNQGKKIDDGAGRKRVGTGTLLLNRPVKEARGHEAVGGKVVPSRNSASPSRVTFPDASEIPACWTFSAWSDTNTPFLPMNWVVKAPLIEVIGISSQQMNSVNVDNWFSLPIVLGLHRRNRG